MSKDESPFEGKPIAAFSAHGSRQPPQSSASRGPRRSGQYWARHLAVVLFLVLVAQAFGNFPSLFWLPVLVLAVLSTAFAATRVWVKVIAVNGFAVLLAFAGYEIHLAYTETSGEPTKMEGTIVNDFTQVDDLVGYRPRAGAQVSARKRFGDQVIYDVAYTINEHGFRVSPPTNLTDSDRCAIFLGDSISFGEGVNDNEAFAYRAPGMANQSWRSYNMAFSGWGPHQMLAMLQDRLPAHIAACRTRRWVHLTIVEHVPRVAGLASWDRHGPRYVLGDDGKPVRNGHFDSPQQLLGSWQTPAWLKNTLDGWRTWQRVFGRNRAVNEHDFQLYLAVLRESARLAVSNSVEARFDLILWDGSADERLARIESAMQAEGVTVHRLTRIIDDFPRNSHRYLLNPHDGHPNPLMHERIAAYVARNILRP